MRFNIPSKVRPKKRAIYYLVRDDGKCFYYVFNNAIIFHIRCSRYRKTIKLIIIIVLFTGKNIVFFTCEIIPSAK